MTPISRRDVLTGWAASSAASIVPVRSEERQSSAVGNAGLLSNDERSQHADALLLYFGGNAPQLLRAPDGILKHPSDAPSLPGEAAIQLKFSIELQPNDEVDWYRPARSLRLTGAPNGQIKALSEFRRLHPLKKPPRRAGNPPRSRRSHPTRNRR